MASDQDVVTERKLVLPKTDMMREVRDPKTASTTAGKEFPEVDNAAYVANLTTYQYFMIEGVVSGLYNAGDVKVEGNFWCDGAVSGTVVVEVGWSRRPLGVDVTLADDVDYKPVSVTIDQAVLTPYLFSLQFTQAEADGIGPKDMVWLILRRRRAGSDDAAGGARFVPLTVTARGV